MRALPVLDLGAGVAVAAAIAQMVGAYPAPPLAELRAASPSSTVHRQALMDADLFGGAVALAMGVAGGLLTRSTLPVLLTLGGFLLISAAHHIILASPSIG